MAKKLVDQDEAARILGVSPEEIGSLRDRKKLYAYRDGADWKFKQEDVEKLRDELRQETGPGSGGEEDVLHAEPKKTGESWDSTLGHVELELNDDLDSILLSEIELGKPPKDGPSTVIGKTEGDGGSDDDMVLADPAAKPAAPVSGGSSALNLEGSGLTLTSSSGVGSGIGGGKGKGSDVKLVASGSDVGKKPPGAGSSDKLFGSDSLTLSEDELTLVAPEEPKAAKPSGGSSIKLGSEDDLDSVFTDKPGGSDVTQSPNDSGIMLASPSDSGLSLEEPLTLGSSAKKLLEENPAIAAGATGIGLVPSGSKVEDEFQLSSAAEAGVEDSDSGSQVIALDSDEDISSGMFAPVAQPGLVEEETVAIPASDVPMLSPAPTSVAPSPAMMATTATLEAPFSTWNVVSLIACAVFLLLCGMMIYDLLKNMWSWNGPSTVSSSIMDALGNSIGWFDK